MNALRLAVAGLALALAGCGLVGSPPPPDPENVEHKGRTLRAWKGNT